MSDHQIVDAGVGLRPLDPEGVDEYGETFEQAWARYRANHPEVAAVWGQQNGRWPNCTCLPCDPERRRPRPNIFADQQDA